MYKFTLSLFLLLAFAGVNPTELVGQADNPIMIIRCRSFEFEAFSESKKPTSQSKTLSTCPTGYIPTENGGCIPDCNYNNAGSFSYTYNPETGLCKCDEPITVSLKGTNSKVEESCMDFCFIPPDITFRKVIDESGPDCNPCLDNQLYLNGICYEPNDCFDGLVDINPTVDCDNAFEGMVPVQLSISGLNEALVDGDYVFLNDITNCLSPDDAFVEYLQLATDGINSNTSENTNFAFGPALDGIIEINFSANTNALVEIDLDNGQSFEIQTCAEDPCSCENPGNIRQNGAIVRFADELSLSGLPANVSIGLIMNNNPQGFANENGDGFIPSPLGSTDEDGNFKFPFYRDSNQGVDIVYQYTDPTRGTSIQRTFVNNMTCDASDCVTIPSMGQWGLFILALLLSSIGLVLITQRKTA